MNDIDINKLEFIGGIKIDLAFIISLFIGVFLSYFILYFHEFGHAIFAIIFTKQKVKIRLGGIFDKKPLKIGRLLIYINGFYPSYGVIYWNAKSLSKYKNALISLGVPLFSLLLSLMIWCFLKYNTYQYINQNMVKFLFVYSVWQFFITIIPIKYPKFLGAYAGFNSDGLNVLKYLVNKS